MHNGRSPLDAFLTGLAPYSAAMAVYRGYTGLGTIMPAGEPVSFIISFVTVYKFGINVYELNFIDWKNFLFNMLI